MKIKEFSLDNVAWDKFCIESDDCWFWHTTDWQKYILEYTKDNCELFSFYVEDGNGDILAICPLIRENNTFSFGGNPCPNVAVRNDIGTKMRKKLIKKCISNANKIALKHKIKEYKSELSNLSKSRLIPYPNRYNILMEYGFENVSINTQILDLSKDEKTLWSEIKKSHRNEIKKGKDLKIFLHLPYTKDLAFFWGFQNLHKLAAGRQTRSDESWRMQHRWKTNGNGLLASAHFDNEFVGAIFVILYKDSAYYAVSANHHNYDDMSISHVLQWEIIKWLRNNRYRYYELGWQYFGDQPYDHPTDKDLEISKFKRHFGGHTIPYFRGIKKY